ncbi:hypothetical protein KKF32_02160 [Patescibacteria group bacterium]|nr:hypothetical protein [Patescibacteria group bacterium]
MSKKKKLIILGVIVLVIIGLAIALLLYEKFPGSKVGDQEQKGDLAVDETLPRLPDVVETSKPQSPLTSLESRVTTVARNFAERFSSFSTDSQYSNLEEVEVLASARLIKQLEQIRQEVADNQGYYGITSKVLKTKINFLDEASGTAEVTVTLQREESRQGQAPVVYYQNLDLSLISSGQNWLVDKVQWQ